MKLSFVEKKKPDYSRIDQLLARCEPVNQWANRGPLYWALAEEFSAHMALPDGTVLVPVANGGVALEAMARVQAHQAGRPLRWIAPAYTFSNMGRGYFHDVTFVDCTADGRLDLAQCAALDPDSYDGLILTNPFGLFTDVSAYADFARTQGKRLLIDNAAGVHTVLPDWPWQALSLHHTKPYGVGEGGFALVPEEVAETLYGLLDYRSDHDRSPHWFQNGKVSDVACAFHLDRLGRVGDWAPRYVEQRERMIALAAGVGLTPLALPQSDIPLTNIPFLAEGLLSHGQIGATRHITMAKYYRPVADRSCAHDLYARAVNVPCHPDLAELRDDQITEDLGGLLAAPEQSSA